ncbi:uncharacterized protein N7503_004130 [Penicillium pulvis]|uniref:uncharacterized protein n=1 Tax=Penicillium pulvis TaxID=1562058 RepID=UPI0025496EFA|nr:uncharacterized protein N7503_004130 [Penicillium pulvis]KAJ5806528.1 hypothetical protein N7503_004130 [Penicillium pulvis]
MPESYRAYEKRGDYPADVSNESSHGLKECFRQTVTRHIVLRIKDVSIKGREVRYTRRTSTGHREKEITCTEQGGRRNTNGESELHGFFDSTVY